MRIRFGSVWKVIEKVWKLVIPNYDELSSRKWHPGLSIYRGDQPPPQYQKIPTLIGVSNPKKSNNPIAFRLKDPNRKEDFATNFTGAIGPISAGLFGSKYVNGHPGGGRLSEEDLERLENWLGKRGLIRNSK